MARRGESGTVTHASLSTVSCGKCGDPPLPAKVQGVFLRAFAHPRHGNLQVHLINSFSLARSFFHAAYVGCN